MDSDSSSTRIEKLNNTNYHAWKIRIQHILALKDLDEFLTEDPPGQEAPQIDIASWVKKDKKAQAIIGLTLSDELLENVRDAESAKLMWLTIKNIFERHTLLNKLSARRRFYTAEMHETESVLKFSNRIRQMAATLKSMGCLISNSEMAMALLNGLPDEYNALISALDAIDSDESELDWEFIKSRIMQEEQRIGMRAKSALAKSESAALVTQGTIKCDGCTKCFAATRTRPTCDFCKKPGHVESKCWKKHPHLNPHKKKPIDAPKPALIANQGDEDPLVCLMAKHQSSSQGASSSNWYIDSGCSNHMTYDKSLFLSYSPGQHSSVELGNGKFAKVVGQGKIRIKIMVEGRRTTCEINNVLLVPELGYQLLSVPMFDKSGLETSFHSGRCIIKRASTTVATGTMVGNLYKLDTHCENHNYTSKALVATSLQLWHQRLAHVQPSVIMQMCKHGTATGIQLSASSDSFPCKDCIMGKAHRAPIPKKALSRSTRLLELVHSDVNGPLEVPSVGGSRYFITFIDDFSRWTVVYTMRKKSEAFEYFRKFKAYAEKHTREQVAALNIIRRSHRSYEEVTTIRTDNGGEYLSNDFKSFLQQHGINHQLTIAYTPQQNGVAERMNRTLLDLVRSMLSSRQVGKKFWAEALATAVYVRNRVTSRALPINTTPYHHWMGKVPNLSHFRVFGSKCWYVVPRKNVRKLDPRSNEGMFIGYSTQSKGYKIWDPAFNKIVVSRDVRFDESMSCNPSNFRSPSESTDVAIQGGEDDLASNIIAEEKEQQVDEREHEEEEVNCQTESGEHAEDQAGEQDPDEEDSSSDDQFQDTLDTSAGQVRRSTRARQPPKEWWKTTNNLAQAFSVQAVPSSYSTATNQENIDFWKPGIQREHDCIMRSNTWELVDRAPGMHILPSKYVFRVKNGLPKVRLVAMGCRQIQGVDYNDTYAPVVTMTTIRTILALTASLDLELEQMDVVTAFLNGDLKEDIYMQVPEGFRDASNTNKVCKLNKSLYGLKQAPRQWYAKMHDFLVTSCNFKSSQNDPCLYFRHNGKDITLICLYVDDLLIAGSDKNDISKIKGELSSRFEMKDLGPATTMLGVEISRDRTAKKLFINQQEYTNTVLERFGMENSKPVATPMEKDDSSPTEDQRDLCKSIPYRQAIGSIMYLMICTRPDLAYAIGKLSQYSESPKEHHWIALKRVLRYIKGTQTYGIMYNGSKLKSIAGYSDADWGGCKASRKSTSGNVFLVSGGAVSWRSKKQTCVALSTCEAEYIATCLAAKEAVWLARLLKDIHYTNAVSPITIGVDNNGAIDTAYNSSTNRRNKHIDLVYHYVRDCTAENKISIVHCDTSEQPADIFTKPLDRIKFQKFRSMQGIQSCDFSSPLVRGGVLESKVFSLHS